MSFKVFHISSLSELDTLPVAVIKDYPLEKRDYKPYAQCNICLDSRSLFVRMWAFELSPPQGSELRGVFYLFPQKPELALALSLKPDGSCAFSLLEESGLERAINPPSGFALHPHNGEDLQGIYWGGLAALPLDWLETLGGTLNLDEGRALAGNFYKLCPGPEMAHSGSFFPADFAGDPYSGDSMGRLVIAPQ
ncbi:MAG: hypothetical protein FWE19_03075 [Oscillospiraceae bacterium]|nr:hypothetical protein [Oscillospiraceae bacterium]